MKAAVILAALMFAGCSTTSGSFCQIAPQLKYSQPVYDAMTDAEAARHLAYLKTGEKLCGWRP
jgi:outer membrane murein-binding lipoprotein Lpp